MEMKWKIELLIQTDDTLIIVMVIKLQRNGVCMGIQYKYDKSKQSSMKKMCYDLVDKKAWENIWFPFLIR